MSIMNDFKNKRDRLNEIMKKYNGLSTKRFLSLDNQMYRDGALDKKTKELLGLVASMVLRCDDCIKYHLENCFKAGYTDEQIDEAMGIAMLVGGSIVIPHLRRAFEVWNEMKNNA